MKIKHGITRTVFIFKSFVIKIPRFKSVATFANGLLGNINELHFGSVKNKKQYSKHLMPVLRGSCPFWIIMPRGNDISEPDYEQLIEPKFFEIIRGETHPFSDCIDPDTGNILPIENKNCSWKKYKGKYVAVDYGSGFGS